MSEKDTSYYDFIDEEAVPHAFVPQETGAVAPDTDEHGPIWCQLCVYHRDNAIHEPAS